MQNTNQKSLGPNYLNQNSSPLKQRKQNSSNNSDKNTVQNFNQNSKKEDKWNKSQVLLSIMLKPELCNYHQVIKSAVHKSKQILATGSKQGDILLWELQQNGDQQEDQIYNQDNFQLQPYQFLIPCLSQSVGRITMLLFIDNPLIRCIDQTKQCLMSVHIDNRVRLWDLNDGRCFNISPHNIFPGNQEIHLCEPLRANFSRFYVFAGGSNNVFIFDSWKMKLLTYIQLSDKIIEVVGLQVNFNDRLIYVYDSNNMLYLVDYDQIDHDKYNIYDTYIQDTENIQKSLKQQKLNMKGKIDLKISYTPKCFYLDIQNDLLVVVYTMQIYFYNLSIINQKIAELQQESEILKSQNQNYTKDFMQNFSQSYFKKQDYQQQLKQIEDQKLQEQERQKKAIKLRYIIMQNYKDYDYQALSQIQIESQNYYIVESKEGSCFILSVENVNQIFSLVDQSYEHEFQFNFRGFSLLKQPNQYTCSFNYKMPEIFIRNENQQQIHKIKGYNLNTINQQQYQILSYNIDKSTFECFYIKDFVQKYNENINLILKMGLITDNSMLEESEYKIITSNNFYVKLNVPSDNLQLIKSSVSLQSGVTNFGLPNVEQIEPLYNYQFNNEGLREGPKLKDKINNIFHDQFMDVYRKGFEQQIEDCTVSISITCFAEKKDPFIFFGTKEGFLYGFPLVYDYKGADDIQKLQILKLELPSKSSVKFIHFMRNILIVSQECGFLTVLSLDKFKEKLNPKQDKKNAKRDQQQQLEQEQEQQNQQNSDVFIVQNIQSLVIYQQVLNQPVKRVQKIKIFESLQNDTNNNTEIVQKSKKLLKQQFALILMNNSINIFSTKTQQIEYNLSDPGSGSIYNVFSHCIMDYFIILTSNGKMHFWSMGSGRFERTEPFQKFYKIFAVESLIKKNFQGIEDYNNYSVFKKNETNTISEYHSLLEYNNRYLDHIVNFFEESNKKTRTNKHAYESLGDLRKLDYNAETDIPHIVWALLERKNLQYQSYSKANAMSVLKVRMNSQKNDNYYNVNYMLFVDCKKHNNNIYDIFEYSSDPLEHRLFSYVPFIFPWEVDQKLDVEIGKYLHYKRPTLKFQIGVNGLANSFSFNVRNLNKHQQPIKPDDIEIQENQLSQKQIQRNFYNHNSWSTSQFLTTNMGIGLLLHFITLGQFRGKKPYQLMLETAGYLTKNKRKITPQFKSLNLSILSRFCIDNSYEVMNSASNLIISSILNKEVDYSLYKTQLMDYLTLNLNFMKKKQQPNMEQSLSIIEVMWLITLSFINIFGETKVQGVETCINRVIQGINLINCLHNPNLVAPCMKILVEGIKIWRNTIIDYKSLLQNLMFIYFHYNTNKDYKELLKDTPNLQQKQKGLLDEFLGQSDQVRKRMKVLTIKTIIALAQLNLNDFFSLIKKEIVNIERHPIYPCSVIDMTRNYIKSDDETAQKHLPFFIEIILRSLDPNNPSYRRICHKPATIALDTIFKKFRNVSFHQTTQKIVVGTYESQILIYDLRTAAKWRVLDGHEGPVNVVKFDESGKHIASYSVADSSIRIWKVGSTGFWGSILNMSGSHQKKIMVPKQHSKKEEEQTNKNTQLTWTQEDKFINIIFSNDQALQFKAT